MLTAEQKTRLTLTGGLVGEPRFQHEGEKVMRWITGGLQPDIYVTFHQTGNVIEVRCAICQINLGYIDAHYEGNIRQQLAAIRQVGHQHNE